MNKFWLMSMIWIAVAGVVLGWVRHADAHGQGDAQQLLEAVRPLLAGEARIVFKYNANYGNCGQDKEQLLDTGRRLSSVAGLPEMQLLSESNGNAVYRAEAAVAGGTAVLTVASPAGQVACYAALRLETAGTEAEAAALQWQEQAESALRQAGMESQWNVMVQGTVSEAAVSGTYGDPASMMDGVLDAVGGKAVESYSDAATISVSARADRFQSYVLSGDEQVHVQAALHRESTSGQWRLTVGTPVITMEY